MGGLLTDLVGVILEALVWVFGLLTESILKITTLSEKGFSDTFSKSLLGSDGIYHTESGSALIPDSADQILSIVAGVGLCFIVLMMVFQLIRSMLFKDYHPDNPLRVVGRGLIFAFIISNYKLIVDTLIGLVFAPIYKTAEEQENLSGMLVEGFSDIGRSTSAYPTDSVTNAIQQAGSTVLELLMINAVFIISVLKLVVVFHLLMKFLALALEIIERFVEMFFLTIFGPLCIAVGYNPRSKVFGNWLAFFIDGYVLMAINIFMTKLSLVAIMNFTKAFNAFTAESPPEAVLSIIYTHGEDTKGKIASLFVKWAATYATIKIGCEFDDIMNRLGFKVAQAGGIENSGLLGAIVSGALVRKFSNRLGKSAAKGVMSATAGTAGGSAVVNMVNQNGNTGILGSLSKTWASTPLFGKLPNPWVAVASAGSNAPTATQSANVVNRQNALKKLKAANNIDKSGFKAFGKGNADVWDTMSAAWQSNRTGVMDNAGLKNLTVAMSSIGITGTAVAAEISSRNGVGRTKVTMSNDDGKTSTYVISNGGLADADAYMNGNGEIWSVSSTNVEGIKAINDCYKSNNSNAVEELFNGLNASSNIAHYEVDASKDVLIDSRIADKGDYTMLKDTGELVRIDTDEYGDIQYVMDDMVSYAGTDGRIYETDISNFVSDGDEVLRYKADDIFVLYETTDVSDVKQFEYFKVGDKVDSQRYKISLDENGNATYKSSLLAINYSQLKGTKMTHKEQLMEYGTPIAFVLGKENGTGPVQKVKANYSQDGDHTNNAVISIKNMVSVHDEDGKRMSMLQTKAGALVEVAQGDRKVKDGKVLVPVVMDAATKTVKVQQPNGAMTMMTIPQIEKSGLGHVTDDGYMEVERQNTRVQLFAQHTKDSNDNDIYTVYGEDGKKYTIDKALVRKQVVPVWDSNRKVTVVVTKGPKGKIENVDLSRIEKAANGDVCLYSKDKEGNLKRSVYGGFVKVGDEYKFVDESCVGYEVKGLNTQTYVSGGPSDMVGVATDDEGKVHIDTDAEVYEYGSGKYGFKTKEGNSPVLMSVERDGSRRFSSSDEDKTYNAVDMKYGRGGHVKVEAVSSYSPEMYGDSNREGLRSILEGMTDDSRIEIKDVRTNDLQSSGFMSTKETDPDNYGELTRYDWYDVSRYEFDELVKKARKTEEEEEMLMKLEKARKEISDGNTFYRLKSDRQTRKFMKRFLKK